MFTEVNKKYEECIPIFWYNITISCKMPIRELFIKQKYIKKIFQQKSSIHIRQMPNYVISTNIIISIIKNKKIISTKRNFIVLHSRYLLRYSSPKQMKITNSMKIDITKYRLIIHNNYSSSSSVYQFSLHLDFIILIGGYCRLFNVPKAIIYMISTYYDTNNDYAEVFRFGTNNINIFIEWIHNIKSSIYYYVKY